MVKFTRIFFSVIALFLTLITNPTALYAQSPITSDAHPRITFYNKGKINSLSTTGRVLYQKADGTNAQSTTPVTIGLVPRAYQITLPQNAKITGISVKVIHEYKTYCFYFGESEAKLGIITTGNADVGVIQSKNTITCDVNYQGAVLYSITKNIPDDAVSSPTCW